MSTKTLRKRIALVAVSALGFGLMSVVPANAATTVGSTSAPTSALSLSGTVGKPIAISLKASAVVAGTGAAASALVVTVRAGIVTKPAGSAVADGVSLAAGNNASAIQHATLYSVPSKTSPGTPWGVPAIVTSANSVKTTLASGDTMVSFTNKTIGTAYLVPDLAGTYTVKVGVDATAAASDANSYASGAVTYTITVTAPTTSSVIQRAVARSDKSDVVVMQAVGYTAYSPKLQFVSGPSDQAVSGMTAGTVYSSTTGPITATSITTGVANYSFATATSGVTNGTYTFKAFDDVDGSGTFNAADGTATTLTFTVADDAKGASGLTLQLSTIATDGSTAVVLLTSASVTDNDGVASYLAGGTTTAGDEALTMSVTGITETYTDGGDGTGSVSVPGDTTVGTYTVGIVGPSGTLATHGSTTSLTVLRATGVVTGMTATKTAFLAFDTTNVGVADTSAASATITASTTSAASITYNFTGVTYSAGITVPVTVALSGTTAAGDIVAPSIVSVNPDGTGSFTVTNSAPSTGDKYTITLPKSGGTLGFVVTYAASKPTFLAANVSPAATFTVKNGSSSTVSAILDDGYGVPYASKTVTVTVAGRNPVTTNVTTDATGKISYTVADVPAVATATTDTVTFSHAYISSLGAATSATTTFTITYTATGIVVGNVLVTASATSAVIDTVQQLGTPNAGAKITYTATVTDTSGIPLGSGNVVTFSGAATDIFLNGIKTATTSGLGQATIVVYRNVAGYGTITASIGGKSGSLNTTKWSTDTYDGDTSDVHRSITLTKSADTVSEGIVRVTATVTDRWGNPVADVPLALTLTGAGRLYGSETTTGTTNADGQKQWNITTAKLETGTATVVIAYSGSFAGQTLDLAGFISNGGTTYTVSGVTAGNTKASTTATFSAEVATVTNADVLKSIVALIASINKQIQALQALILKKK